MEMVTEKKATRNAKSGASYFARTAAGVIAFGLFGCLYQQKGEPKVLAEFCGPTAACLGDSVVTPSGQRQDSDIVASMPCTEQYQPVCGKDGRTYDNACFAQHVGIAYKGA